jgi:hypothetical protein
MSRVERVRRRLSLSIVEAGLEERRNENRYELILIGKEVG